MNVKEVPLSAIRPWEKNPRIIKDKRFDALCRSMEKEKEFLGCRPIVARKDGVIIGGNMRYRAAKHLGWKTVPVAFLDVDDAKAKKLALLDNGQFGEWQMDDLSSIIAELGDGFDVSELGFDSSLQKLIEEALHPKIEEDDVPQVRKKTKIKLGDLFHLGEHRLLCGDATKREDVENLMGGEKADLLFTDPPYGVSYGDKNKFLNAISPGNRIQENLQNDTLKKYDMKVMWITAFEKAREHCKGGAAYYVCSPQGGELMMMMMMSLVESGWELKHCIIWVKNNFVLGRSDYHYKHEPILYGWNPGARHQFYGGKGECSVWEIPKPQKSDLHPTMKPVALVAKAIGNSTKGEDIVLDPFGGSGSTLIACEQLGRKCRMMEIDPIYCQVIIDRWESFTGKKAKLLDSVKNPRKPQNRKTSSRKP